MSGLKNFNLLNVNLEAYTKYASGATCEMWVILVLARGLQSFSSCLLECAGPGVLRARISRPVWHICCRYDMMSAMTEQRSADVMVLFLWWHFGFNLAIFCADSIIWLQNNWPYLWVSNIWETMKLVKKWLILILCLFVLFVCWNGWSHTF